MKGLSKVRLDEEERPFDPPNIKKEKR